MHFYIPSNLNYYIQLLIDIHGKNFSLLYILLYIFMPKIY